MEVEVRALSVVWTTPLVATLGMSLTIPIAMVADMVIHGRHYSAVYILGSVQVLLSCSSVFFTYLDLCPKSTILNKISTKVKQKQLLLLAPHVQFCIPLNCSGLLLHAFVISFTMCTCFFSRYFLALLLPTLQIEFHVL
uniref:Uncharacterized protein n=1 Tax=Arundo donax TaxID=35708 RepID=A0A0A9DKK5_ARUDO